MITTAIIIWCILGVWGMVYFRLKCGEDVTLSNLIIFCFLGPFIGHILAVIMFMCEHPVTIWKEKK